MPTISARGFKAGWRGAVGAESQGLVGDVTAAWSDLRGSIRAQIAANPPESRLLAYLYIACVVGFIAGLPSAYRQAATLTEEGALVGVIVGRLFAALFFAPLFFYGLAALSHLIARGFKGKGSYYTARIALIWALCVSLPLVILSGLATAFLTGAPAISMSIQILTSFGFLWIWAAFIAESEYFKSPFSVFLVALGLVAAIMGSLLLIRLD